MDLSPDEAVVRGPDGVERSTAQKPLRAQGAILGKAMTGLQSGKGLVLVLVTLQ